MADDVHYPDLRGQPSAPIEDEDDINLDETMEHETNSLNAADANMDNDQEARSPQGDGVNPTVDFPSRNTRSRSRASGTPISDPGPACDGVQVPSPPRFVANPELHEFYNKVYCYRKRLYENQCKLCGKNMLSHNTERLFDHLALRCPAATVDIKVRFTKDQAGSSETPSNKHYWNFRWARIVVKNNLPLRLQSCNLFQSFMKDLGVNLASRERLGNYYIEKLARRTDNRFAVLTASLEDNHLSLEFDHWSDVNKRSILGTVATFNNGARHLLAIQDVSARGHDSSATVECLKSVLSSINPSKINSIVSDSAASCALARLKLTDEPTFKHVLSHRCTAHWLNLIGRGICATRAASEIIYEVNSIIVEISSDTKISALLREAQIRRCIRAVPTRWYSTVLSLASLYDIREKAFDLITRENDMNTRSRGNILRSLDGSRTIYSDIGRLIKVLLPLAECIAVAEESDGSLSRPMAKVLEFAKQILDGDWADEFTFAAIESFFTYFSTDKLKEEYGLLLAAYALDHTNNMNYLTRQGEKFILVNLSAIAKLSGYKNNYKKKELAKEMAKFAKRERPFNGPAVPGGPEQWWIKAPDTTILRKVALRICSLRSSSANVERVFSTLKYIQAPNRLNASLKTIENIAKVRIAEYHENNLAAFDSSDLIEHDDLYEMNSREQNESSQSSSQRDSRLGRIISQITGFTRQGESRSANPNHRPELFKTLKVKDSYLKFMSLIDFSIIRNYSNTDLDTTIEMSEEEFLDELVGDYEMYRE